MGTTSNFFIIVLGRCISGVGATVIPIVASQALAQSFTKNNLGIAMGISNTAVPAGNFFALNILAWMGNYWNWRFSILFTTLCCIIMLFVCWKYSYLITISQINGNNKKVNINNLKSAFSSIKSLKGNVPMLILSISWMAFMFAFMSSITFAPDFFINKGYSIVLAGFVTGFFTLGPIFISPIMGVMLDRVKSNEVFLIVSGISLALMYQLLFFQIGSPIILSIFIGLVSGVVPVSIWTMVPRFLPSKQLGLGFGILRVCESIGLLFGPIGVGLTYDLTGGYFYGFILISIFTLGAAGSAMYLKAFSSKIYQANSNEYS